MNTQLRQQFNKSEGYTLIEIIIVLMITSVVFVSIYSLFSKSMRSDAEGRYEIVAAELAEKKMKWIGRRMIRTQRCF